MAGWAQLLDIHMYLELADFAGIAEVDLHLASYNLKMMGFLPEDMDEVARGIESRWARIGVLVHQKELLRRDSRRDALSDQPLACVCV